MKCGGTRLGPTTYGTPQSSKGEDSEHYLEQPRHQDDFYQIYVNLCWFIVNMITYLQESLRP